LNFVHENLEKKQLRITFKISSNYNPTTMNTQDEFRNVSVTKADAARKADQNWKL